MLPGSGWWSVAAEDLGAVGAVGGGGAVPVQDQGPAPPVHCHEVVKTAQEQAVVDAGLAAVGLADDVVDVAGASGLAAAAGPFAVAPGAQQDGLPDPGRDGLGVSDVEGEAGAGEPGAQQPGPQRRGEPARPGDQVDGGADDGALEHRPGVPGQAA